MQKNWIGWINLLAMATEKTLLCIRVLTLIELNVDWPKKIQIPTLILILSINQDMKQPILAHNKYFRNR